MARGITQEWITSAGKFPVERRPCPHPGIPVDLTQPPKGILHTIEGSLDSGMSVFRQHYAPHFALGRDSAGRVRIYQLVPLGYMGAALLNAGGGVETNRWVRAQIELAGYSRSEPWLPDEGVTEALASLFAELWRVAGIPLVRRKANRDPELWRNAFGWLGHVDVPENDHTDPGAFKYASVLARARLLANPVPKPPVTPKRRATLRAWILGRLRNGWTWAKIKSTPNWREFRCGGGR